MALSPGQQRQLIVAEELRRTGFHWFDDNPLGWEEVYPPNGASISEWDRLTISIANPVRSNGDSANLPSASGLQGSEGLARAPSLNEHTFWADVSGKSDIKIDKKQVPGQNAAQVTIIGLAADEITSVLYLLTPADLLSFIELVPTKILAVTRADLLRAAKRSGALAAVEITNLTEVQEANVPIVELTHPAIQIAGRRYFILKSMGFVIPPRDGRPPMVSLTWTPMEFYTQSTIRTAQFLLDASPGNASQSTTTTAVSPAQVPPKPAQ